MADTLNQVETVELDPHEMECRDRDSISFGYGYFNTDTEKVSHDLIDLLRQRQFPTHLIQHAVELAWRFERSADVKAYIDCTLEHMLESKVESNARRRADYQKYQAEAAERLKERVRAAEFGRPPNCPPEMSREWWQGEGQMALPDDPKQD